MNYVEVTMKVHLLRLSSEVVVYSLFYTSISIHYYHECMSYYKD